MDFSLNQEQEMFREYVRKYLTDMEQTKVARDYTENKIEHVKAVLSELHELGCTQLNIPEKYGGMGLGKLDLVPIMEEMGRAIVGSVFRNKCICRTNHRTIRYRRAKGNLFTASCKW